MNTFYVEHTAEHKAQKLHYTWEWLSVYINLVFSDFTTRGKYPRELRGRIAGRCHGIIGALLDVQFLMVLTHSSSLCSEGV